MFLKPAARRLPATQFAPRSISGLCSLLALTLGMRRNSNSSARCWSRRASIKSARFIRGPHGTGVLFQKEYANLGANVCGSGMNVNLRMTGRRRASILGPPQLCAQASRFPDDIARAESSEPQLLHPEHKEKIVRYCR